MKRIYSSRGMHAQLLCDLLNAKGVPARFGWDAAESDDASVWIVEDSDYERALRFVEEFSRPSSGEQQAATWRCSICGETLEEQFDACWKCSAPEADSEGDLSPAESERAVSESNLGAHERTPLSRVLARPLGALFVFLGGLFVLSSTLYTLDETEQAIITRFGRLVGREDSPGLHFKEPFIQEVHRFDKRCLAWDGDAIRITTKDEVSLWVDTYASWRISDPLRFFQSARDERGAQSRLDDIIDRETSNVAAGMDLIEIVRSSNRKFEVPKELTGFVNREAQQPVVDGRDELARVILERASQVAEDFGIELVEVRLKRINYVEEVRAKVFERMISERQQISERIRSEGQERSAEIRGQKENQPER